MAANDSPDEGKKPAAAAPSNREDEIPATAIARELAQSLTAAADEADQQREVGDDV